MTRDLVFELLQEYAEIPRSADSWTGMRVNDYGRFAIQDRLEAMGAEAQPFLIDALQTPAHQGLAIYLLGKIGDPRSVPHFKALMPDGPRPARLAIAGALGEIMDVSSARLLLNSLADGLKPVRDQAARSLEWLLLKSLVAPEHRRVAVVILSRLDGLEAAPQLRVCGPSGSRSRHLEAARALGSILTASSFHLLRDCLANESWRVRGAAARALEQLETDHRLSLHEILSTSELTAVRSHAAMASPAVD